MPLARLDNIAADRDQDVVTAVRLAVVIWSDLRRVRRTGLIIAVGSEHCAACHQFIDNDRIRQNDAAVLRRPSRHDEDARVYRVEERLS